ncbi:MAG: hypothetical protein QG570_465 [Patescibacteria group bacterium]|nr:hypothetical protein [Patescibacteria group bacterium]
MKNWLTEHKILEIFQYILLLIVVAVSAIFFANVSSNLLRFFIILFDGIFYVVWGLWHHHHKERIDKYVFYEYLLVSIFVVFLSAIGLGVIRFF